jgi:3-oxoacyl-[acyl-carrier protein] reductase
MSVIDDAPARSLAGRMSLAGRRVLVTGGSRGIGRAVALAFAEQGAHVVAVGRTPQAAPALAAELAAAGPGSHLVASADLSRPDSAQQLLETAGSHLGGLDVLVNNAGVVSHSTLEDMDPAEWQRVLDVNLTGLFRVTQEALWHLADGGSIINVSSAVARRGMVGRTHYTASKAGVIGFTRSLAKEVGVRGIRANVIAPGIIETDQTAALDEAGRARYEQLTSVKRLGAPEDIAGVALFLASDLSRYVTGSVIVADGGI